MDPLTCVNNYAISSLPDVKFGMSCTWDLLWVLPQKNEACWNCPRIQLLQGAKLHRGSVFIYTFSTLWPHLLASSICENLLPFKVHIQFSYKFRHGLFHIFNCRLHINQGSWLIHWQFVYIVEVGTGHHNLPTTDGSWQQPSLYSCHSYPTGLNTSSSVCSL